MSTLWEIYHKHWKADTNEIVVRSTNSGRCAIITGMRPEDEEGGCMASGTPAIIFGRNMDPLKPESWYGAPFGLDDNYPYWEFVAEAKRMPPTFVKLEHSIAEHHIEKLKGDIRFWKGMFLSLGFLILIVHFTSCEKREKAVVSSGCQRTEEEARERVVSEAFAECYPNGWKPSRFFQMNKCLTVDFFGWSADGEITCE